jgi:hypothetical protein
MRTKTDPLKTLEARVRALEEGEQARILGISKVLYVHSGNLMSLMNELHDTVEKLDSDLVEKGLMPGASPATQKAYAEWLEKPDFPEDTAKRSEQAEMGAG